MTRNLQLAAFLACSWFWCIGGFFPILLYLEFGGISFPFFLAFNVLGAMLFAFVWQQASRSDFLKRFTQSTRNFSAVIVGYHVIFIMWISLLLQDARPLIGFVLVALAFTALRKHLAVLATGLVGLTGCLFWFIASTPTAAVAPPTPSPFIHQILPLAFGFLLAPYFDRTFHRAFAAASRPRLVFVIGFGGIFSAMLCGVYLGMPAFVGLISAGGLADPAVAAVATLLVLQTGFTTAAHLRELECPAWHKQPFMKVSISLVAILGSCHVLTFFAWPDLLQAGGELIYRNFVFVVGVIFPILLILGGLNKHAIAAIAFVTPCFALGFLIGGAFAPMLSVAMTGLALFYWHRSKQRTTASGRFAEDLS